MRQCAIASFVWLLGAGLANADPLTLQNGSFEMGLTGWTVTMPQVILGYHGLNEIVDVGRAFVETVDPLYVPDGSSWLNMATQEGCHCVGAPTVDFSVSQPVTVTAGNTISGVARFGDGDMVVQDFAWVRIFNSLGVLVAQPWFAQSGYDGPGNPMADWTQWSWQALSAGTYTIALGMTATGDNALTSHAYFDNVTQTVPEPNSLALTALALLVAGGLRRCNKTTAI